MVATVGSIEVTLKLLGSEQYTAAMRGTAAATESAAQRIEKSTVNAGKGAESLGRSLSNVSGSNSGLNSLALSALRADSNVQGLTKSFYALGAAVGGISGALAVKAVTNYADAYTNVQNKIAAVVSDSKERIGIENDLFGVAQRSRSSLESTVALYSRLRLASENLGASQKDILKVVEATQKAFVVGGSTVQEAASTATQLAQALGSGKLSGDEFRAISENAPILFKAIAKEFGVGTGDLKQMASDGELTAKRVFRAIINSAAEVDEAFARTTPTIEAGIQQIDNALTRYIGQADKSLGASKTLSNGLKFVAENIQVVGDAAAGLALTLAGTALLRGVVGLGQRISEPFLVAKAVAKREVAELENIADTALKASKAALDRHSAVSARRTAHAASPLIDQADPELKQRFQQQAAEVDKLGGAVQKATEKQTAALMKVVEAENMVASAGTAASNRLTSAKAALAKTEETLAGLIRQRASLESAAEKAGQGTLRKDQQSYYNALYRTVDARKQLDDLNAQIAQTRVGIEQAKASRLAAFGGGDDAAVKRHTQEVLQQRIIEKQLMEERFARGRELQTALNQQADAEAQILNRQSTDREKAALAVAKNEEKIAASQSRALSQTQAVAAAEVNAINSRVAAEEKVAQKRAALENQAAQAGAQRRIVENQQAQAQAKLAETTQQIPVSAGVQRDAQQKAVAAANAEVASSLKEVSTTAATAEAAMGRLSAAQIALAGASKAVSGAFSAVIGFLGGGLNAALLGATAAFVAYEIISARSAQTTKEQQEALAGLADRLREVQDIQSKGGQRTGADLIVDRAQLDEGRKAIEGYRQDILNLFAAFDRPQATAGFADGINQVVTALGPLSEAAAKLSIDLPDLVAKLGTLDPASKAGQDNAARLQQAITDIGLANPNFSAAIASINGIISKMMQGIGVANALTNAIANSNAASRKAAYESTLTGTSREELGAQEIDRQMKMHRDAVDADPSLRLPTGPEITKNIQDRKSIDDKITDNIIKTRKDRASRVELEIKKLNEQYPNQDPSAIRQLAEGNVSEDKAGKKGRGGGGGKKSQGVKDAETLAKKLRELDEEARASGLSALDEKVVKFAQSAKVATSDINQFIEAVTNKDLTKVPATMQAIKDGLEAIDAAKFGRKALDEFFPAEKLAHDLHLLDVAAQRSPEIAKNLGQLKFAEIAKNASDFSKDAASAIGDFALSAITDFKNVGDALDKLAKALEKAVLEAAVVKPLENVIKGTLGGLLGGGGGGTGGFNLLSLFSGGLTKAPLSMGPLLPGTSFHRGGLVGARSPDRLVPAGAFAGAPMFHSGFTAREFPAILQYGEMVLTAKQNARTMRTMAGLASSMGNQQGVSFAPKITIVNNNGSGIQARPTNGPEGPGIDIIVDQIVAEKLATPGSASNRAVRQNLGGAQRLTRR